MKKSSFETREINEGNWIWCAGRKRFVCVLKMCPGSSNEIHDCDPVGLNEIFDFFCLKRMKN